MMDDRNSPAFAVAPTHHVQTIEDRFGPDARAEIMEAILQPQTFPFGGDFDDDIDDESIDGADAEDAEADAGVGLATGQAHEGEEEPVPAGEQHQVPRFARTRCNLTVLSQRYNLYFAAYQGKIHVYQPQKAPQILPPAAYILNLNDFKTEASKQIPGYVDPLLPHQMNYITIGDLGNKEVLLMAFDDGDIIAYYTHLIVHAIESRASSSGWRAPRLFPQPFFCDNVGYSAWGLAIHSHSRLIAVTSNKHEVTVFAFATSDKELPTEPQDRSSPITWSGQTALELEKHFVSRTRTWRIVLPFGTEGQNSPSVAFLDDHRGDANMVVAVDIVGNTWVHDLWRIGASPALLKPSPNRIGTPPSYTAWGVLVLSDSSFRPVCSNRAAMGLPANEILGINNSAGDGIKNDIWLDITCSLYHVKNNAADPREYLRLRHNGRYVLPPPKPRSHGALSGDNAVLSASEAGFRDDVSSETDDTDDEEYYASLVPHNQTSTEGSSTRREFCLTTAPAPPGSAIDLAKEEEQGFRLQRIIVPTSGETMNITNEHQLVDFIVQSVRRKVATKPVDMLRFHFPRHIAQGISLLRTTHTGVELQSLDRHSASILCRDVLPRHKPRHFRNHQDSWDMEPHRAERVSMYHHVRELGLVVLGSMCGRVALLSLTKPPNRHGFGTGSSGKGLKIRRAFRVEAVLPRKREEDKRVRPWVPLLGIAVSPVPDHRAKGLELLAEGSRVEVWRLILHYMDHTILMYDIVRAGEDEDIMVI